MAALPKTRGARASRVCVSLASSKNPRHRCRHRSLLLYYYYTLVPSFLIFFSSCLFCTHTHTSVNSPSRDRAMDVNKRFSKTVELDFKENCRRATYSGQFLGNYHNSFKTLNTVRGKEMMSLLGESLRHFLYNRIYCIAKKRA